MPLLRKQQFQRKPPAKDLRPEEEVFYCEATKEVFRDYDEFFQRTILCNSLVWSCAITGKTNLTYEEALESEKKARKRLGAIPKPLKRGLLWLASRTRRGRIGDLVDDVYVYACNRFFQGEIVEAVVKEQWCDCRILRVIPPSEEEVAQDAKEEAEEAAKSDSSPATKQKLKDKKVFTPPDHLFKYEVEEVEPDEPEVNELHVIDADDIRREKGTYTREKNLLFLKNIVELGKDANFSLKKDISDKFKLGELSFGDIFAGPEPVFEESKRMKGLGHSSMHHTAKKKPDDKKHKDGKHQGSKGGKVGKGQQGTLDSWVKGEKGANPAASAAGSHKAAKKQTPAEIEADMKRIREQNQRFKEEMRIRTEEAKQRKLEEKAREKERRKEEKRLLNELMNEWKKRRDDLECDDLKELPRPRPIHCKVPNQLFGDFLTLSEFFVAFAELLETEHSFPHGITFDVLQEALTDQTTVGGPLQDLLSFMLGALFDLQDEEDDEVKLDKLTANADAIDKNILGKDEDIASQIKSATIMAQWPMKTQGLKLRELHMDQWSITEILRLHLEAAGAFRSEKLIMWLYQQRGGYRLSDDPGLHFRMEEPQILEALTFKTVFELSVHEKLKILNCLMYQILTFASVRDIIDERFHELSEAKTELRTHQMAENKRHKAVEEAEKVKRREERLQKKEDPPKPQPEEGDKKEEEKSKNKSENSSSSEAHLTERQRLAIQTQKEKEDKRRMREEDLKRSEALEQEQDLQAKVSELQSKCGMTFLGRDRAYRRYWALETLPGLFVENDDETVGPCLERSTPLDPDSGPMDEATALKKVQEILNSRGKSSEEKASSDKENDQADDPHKMADVSKTYSKKQLQQPALKQKVLSAKNGTLDVAAASSTSSTSNGTSSDQKTETTEDDVDEDAKGKLEDLDSLPWGACLADTENCPVHSTILPKTHWAYFSSVKELDSLIGSLNERGIRESELKEKLISERDRLVPKLEEFDMTKAFSLQQSVVGDVKEEESMDVDDKNNSSLASAVDLTLRDQLLDLEERLFFGTLGTLKVRDRAAWQEAIQNGGYDKQCKALTWGGKSSHDTPFESRLQSNDHSRAGSPENKRDSSGSSSSQADRDRRRRIQDLASAVLQIAQMVDEKYIKAPLGEEEKEKKKRLKEEDKRKKERDEEEAEGIIADQTTAREKILTPLQAWENSLMSCTSCAQVFVHLTTLENSIVWSKSLLNAKCRLCRRKTDPDNMLLCDGCDRGHHTYCLKPKLKTIPEGDWYCHDCKPKERVRSPKKKSRRVFTPAEYEEEERDEGGDSDEEASDSADEESESEQQAPPQKGAQSRQQDESEEEEDDEEEEEEAEQEDMEVDQDRTSDVSEDEDDVPLKRSKKKRSVEPAPKKSKKQQGSAAADAAAASGSSSRRAAAAASSSSSSSLPSISQLLGKRRCAAEASEKIARATMESHSGSSSGAEESSSAVEMSSSSNGTAASRSTRSVRSKRSFDAMTSSTGANGTANSAASSNSCARSKRRKAVDDEVRAMFNPTVLEDLLNAMMKHKDGWPFDRPITKADAPDYHKIIKRPMDLGTIRSNINRMKYSCNQEVIEDILLVFKNCAIYNKEDAEEFVCGVRLEKYFRREAKKLGLLNDDDDNAKGGGGGKKPRRTY